MDRKAMAKETLRIIDQGYYEADGTHVDIQSMQKASVKGSFLLTPEQGEELLTAYKNHTINNEKNTELITLNCATVDAVLRLTAEGKHPAVLNFASAKNPGGGFLNGAKAQEESLAVSGCLYETQLAHETYYKKNRACGTMMYTNHAIYSPDVVFFRDERFRLMEKPVTASVLTLPAVNMGQVLLKGEDEQKAEEVMRRRMKLSLAIFARQKCEHLVLGAYGCGVFRNDPEKIAQWWKELFNEEFAGIFDTVLFAVLDHSSAGKCIGAFQKVFG
ncbi:MAG: TIGR02452 family protein [Lachnospiraceae bacterium]|nr:TIGR02452 family protein [Lachnospiraceae bacterium]